MTDPQPPICSARGLTIAYRRTPLMVDVDVDVPAGSLVVITGPSGAGKSSLLYCLAGLLRPRSGTVRVAGQDLWALPDRQRSLIRARSMGFLFQDYVLDPSRRVVDNVLEPLAYAGRRPRAPERARAIELLERVGVEVPANRRPGQVSGGQAQRIALARALVVEPSLLLADEPTGSLDAHSGSVVIEVLRTELTRPDPSLRAAVIVTHDLDLAAQADRHLTLDTSGSNPTLRVAP